MTDWCVEAWTKDGADLVVHVQREDGGAKIEGEWTAKDGDVLHDETGAAWRLYGVKTLEPQKGGGVYSWCQAQALDGPANDTTTESAVQEPAQIDLEELIEEADEAAEVVDETPAPVAKSRRKKVVEDADAGE